MNTLKLPLRITEYPHLYKPREWILYDEKQLDKLIEDAGSSYDDYHYNEGNVVFEEDEDGDFIKVHDESQTVEAYLDWLRHDLSSLDVEEISEEEAYGY